MSCLSFTHARLAMLCLLVGLSSVTVGCSDGRPERVPVAGVVRIDGAPLSQGSITFLPAKGRVSFGQLDGQGRFELMTYEPGDGAPLGRAKVAVAGRESLNESQARWLAPKKYSEHATSELEVEITRPTNDLVIDLTWDGGKPFIETDK